MSDVQYQLLQPLPSQVSPGQPFNLSVRLDVPFYDQLSANCSGFHIFIGASHVNGYEITRREDCVPFYESFGDGYPEIGIREVPCSSAG
jgi:hypothetical protein